MNLFNKIKPHQNYKNPKNVINDKTEDKYKSSDQNLLVCNPINKKSDSNDIDNISSFDSDDFNKMDLKNSFELENEKNNFPKMQEEEENFDNIENDFKNINEFENNLNIVGQNSNNNLYIYNIENIENFNKFNTDKLDYDEDFIFEKNLNFENFNNNNDVINIHISDKRKKEAEKQKKEKKLRKKIDLNKTPLPIFECIYCSNEKVVFKHMINEIISDKYLYNCSWNDLKNINLIVSTYLIYNLASNTQLKNIVNLVINYSEYLNKFYSVNTAKEYIQNYAHNLHSHPNSEQEKYKPNIKYRFICYENTMMTFFFKNTSNETEFINLILS